MNTLLFASLFTAGLTFASPVSTTRRDDSTAKCSVTGQMTCHGPTQFGICDNGNIVWQDLGPSLYCMDNNGVWGLIPSPDRNAKVPSNETSVTSATTSQNNNSNSCPVDGALVCNGSDRFGLCNFGQIEKWQPVAAGTQCQDGKIAYAQAPDTSTQGNQKRDNLSLGPDVSQANSTNPACSNKGGLVCNGDDQFGLCCEGGYVLEWNPAGPGVHCQDGQLICAGS